MEYAIDNSATTVRGYVDKVVNSDYDLRVKKIMLGIMPHNESLRKPYMNTEYCSGFALEEFATPSELVISSR